MERNTVQNDEQKYINKENYKKTKHRIKQMNNKKNCVLVHYNKIALKQRHNDNSFVPEPDNYSRYKNKSTNTNNPQRVILQQILLQSEGEEPLTRDQVHE